LVNRKQNLISGSLFYFPVQSIDLRGATLWNIETPWRIDD